MKELTPEQQAIADRWAREKEARRKIYDSISEAEAKGEKVDYRKISTQLEELEPDQCEHGRCSSGTCHSCEEIERILFPELFDEEELDE